MSRFTLHATMLHCSGLNGLYIQLFSVSKMLWLFFVSGRRRSSSFSRNRNPFVRLRVLILIVLFFGKPGFSSCSSADNFGFSLGPFVFYVVTMSYK